MFPLLDGLQRVVATLLVAGLYLLPATLGGLMNQIEVDLDTVPSPERIASFVLELPAAVALPVLAEPTTTEAAPTPQPTPRDDLLAQTVDLPMAAAAAPTTTSARKTKGERSGRGEGQSRGRQERCMASTGQVTATGADSWRIERAMLDHYFRDTDAAARLGSAAWSRDARGDIDGIRLQRVRCGSPIDEAGLQKGDVIRSANGKRIDSMAGVIALWWQLRSKDSVKLVVIRDGQRRRLSYSLV